MIRLAETSDLSYVFGCGFLRFLCVPEASTCGFNGFRSVGEAEGRELLGPKLLI
jgi:hypothetical protein